MGGRKKILIAVVNEGEARQLSTAVTDQGWEVLLARDAVGATAMVQRQRPDGVILSHQLPGGGALVALRRIRSSVHTAMIPVIAIADEGSGAAVYRMNGISDTVPPPGDVSVIVRLLIKHFGEPAKAVMEAPAEILASPTRLSSLKRTGLLDSAPSQPYDSLTKVAATLLGVPVALVSLVDAHRQFFKSSFGLPEPWASKRETPLSHSFCQWVVAENEVLRINDARLHPVLHNNRALHELGVIAYAGVPLAATSGDAIGSFCAIDVESHEWRDEDLVLLRELGRAGEACIAVDEFDIWQQKSRHGAEAVDLFRSQVMAAVGTGIAPLTTLLRLGHPRLGTSDRDRLLLVLEWLGRQLVRIAGI